MDQSKFNEVMDEWVQVRTAQLLGPPDHQSDKALDERYTELQGELFTLVKGQHKPYRAAVQLAEQVAAANAVACGPSSGGGALETWLSHWLDEMIGEVYT